ncbi:MAG: DNA cytosine methyltransferase [Pseudomonadales bacterium]|nr:DNA cytosine methyltransferase [Pseudomonadales bacterium]
MWRGPLSGVLVQELLVTKPVPIVDIFSGPGGLAEGFSAFRCPNERQGYRVALSIEKDQAAYRTLRLRAFLRKFDRLPPEYYEFLNDMTSGEPNWAELYPEHWTAACEETRCMELGERRTRDFVRQRVEIIRSEHGGRTVLLGGPPCQSYSVVGRSRNAGNALYDPDRDDRQSLYREYVYVLRRLKPAVAVMENVKGMLSARHNGQLLFPKVMRALARKSGSTRYWLFALASRSGARSWHQGALPQDFLVNAEAHGVPQTRHRVFVVCIRDDIASTLPMELWPRLEPRDDTVSLQEIIGSMPRLRSRLSRGDSPDSWRAAVRRAHDLVRVNQPVMSRDEENRFHRALGCALATADEAAPPCRNSRGGMDITRDCPHELREWLLDENLEALPNNETRAHIPDDLARYLYVVAFGQTFGRSPKTSDFPDVLAPPHTSWHTGKFDDRYRVQLPDRPCTTVTSHLSKDGHYFIHPDPGQVRSLTVREVARLQTFPDNYFFHGSRTEQYIQVGNAVPPFLASQLARLVWAVLNHHDDVRRCPGRPASLPIPKPVHQGTQLPLVTMETT